MPPTLRSSNSAQSSPSATSKGSPGMDTLSTTPSATPRKAPQCSKCKRPRAGHPRSGCPYMDSPSKENKKNQNALEGHLSVALESMAITSPSRVVERDEETKAFIRNRRRMSAQPPLGPSESLLSLTSSSNEIIARLTQPGMFDATSDDHNEVGIMQRSRIVRWQETVAASPVKAMKRSNNAARTLMPGTLIPPTPETSFASSHDPVPTKEEIVSAECSEASESMEIDNVSTVTPSTATRRAKPLTRTMSAMERDIFVSKLSDEACASIYIIPKVDVADIVAKAISLKFFTHIGLCDDDDDSQALVILGRDQHGVDALLRRMENENRKPPFNKSNSPAKEPSTLKTAAGALVVGAVTTWAGLAFS
ncbi:hypothetical protein GALMADRAFT_236786 [Galerina marginata CBS 339.88]|uniref:Uncharacterized protein n=1 Tax=Galerina marginata (strain CBS 339.88) TaxID=685588 RepID=A0A067TP55_GALM3|nr:hypothetical protein GALMADRAFT_236786 [Galerina marginata CBS 339.88]